MVLFTIAAGGLEKDIAPAPVAVFPAMRLPTIVIGGAFTPAIPPPELAAVLPVITLWRTRAAPPAQFRMPAPSPLAVFPVIALSRICVWLSPPIRMPPPPRPPQPWPAALLLIVLNWISGDPK